MGPGGGKTDIARAEEQVAGKAGQQPADWEGELGERRNHNAGHDRNQGEHLDSVGIWSGQNSGQKYCKDRLRSLDGMRERRLHDQE